MVSYILCLFLRQGVICTLFILRHEHRLEVAAVEFLLLSQSDLEVGHMLDDPVSGRPRRRAEAEEPVLPDLRLVRSEGPVVLREGDVRLGAEVLRHDGTLAVDPESATSTSAATVRAAEMHASMFLISSLQGINAVIEVVIGVLRMMACLARGG